MIQHFYNGIKSRLLAGVPTVKRVDFDYGQWKGEQPAKANFSAKAFYIFIPAFTLVTDSKGKCRTTDDFYFEVVYVEHSIRDGDSRIGVAHWGVITDVAKLFNLSRVKLSDIPGTGVSVGDSEDVAVCSTINVEKISPESELSGQIATRVRFRVVVEFLDIVVEDEVDTATPEFTVEIGPSV